MSSQEEDDTDAICQPGLSLVHLSFQSSFHLSTQPTFNKHLFRASSRIWGKLLNSSKLPFIASSVRQ